MKPNPELTPRVPAPGPGDQEITLIGEDAKAKDIPEGFLFILRVLEGKEIGRGYKIEKSPVTLGRDALCDISIVDGRLSRQHAMVFFYSSEFYLKDLGSTNGTFLNEQRVKQNLIKNGDEIRIGQTRFEVVISKQDRS